VKCRLSQLKYNVQMKCLDPSVAKPDDIHEQIEVSSFCKSQETKLNIRVIQVSVRCYIASIPSFSHVRSL
jgi:hypothetical protein